MLLEELFLLEYTQEMGGIRLMPTQNGQLAIDINHYLENGNENAQSKAAILSNCNVGITISKSGRAYITSGLIITTDGKKYTLVTIGQGVNSIKLRELTNNQSSPIPQQPKPNPPKQVVDPMKKADQKYAANARQGENIGDDGFAKARRAGLIK